MSWQLYYAIQSLASLWKQKQYMGRNACNYIPDSRNVGLKAILLLSLYLGRLLSATFSNGRLFFRIASIPSLSLYLIFQACSIALNIAFLVCMRVFYIPFTITFNRTPFMCEYLLSGYSNYFSTQTVNSRKSVHSANEWITFIDMFAQWCYYMCMKQSSTKSDSHE